MNRYELAPEAKTDLIEIVDHIAEDDLDAAVRMWIRFEAVFGLLADNPLMGRERSDLAVRSLRIFPVSNYLIIYRPEPTDIRIVRVLSAARDIDAIIG